MTAVAITVSAAAVFAIGYVCGLVHAVHTARAVVRHTEETAQ